MNGRASSIAAPALAATLASAITLASLGTARAASAIAGTTAGDSERVVGTIAEFESALAEAAPGQIVRLRSGEYRAERPLVVPDGVSVLGSGHMSFDAAGTPSALQPADATTIRAADSLAGDLLTLGDQTTLRGLRVVVPARTNDGKPVPSGNAVVVGSRRSGDRVTAALRESEILTESQHGADGEGPTGRGVVLLTRNPSSQLPHEGARLELAVDTCIVRAPLGNAIFANNFASGGALTLVVRRSRVEGMTSVGGSTSRPDPVTDASVNFRSERTLYQRAAGGIDRIGWQLYGGSGIPFASAGTSASGSKHGVTRVESDGDRIEGFRTGVLAAGYRRVADFSGPGSDNRIELRMRNTIIRSAGDGAADLALLGAISEPAPRGSLALPPGERNVVWADLSGVNGSGERQNRFLDRAGPEGAPGVDDGNRVAIAGRADAFAKSNPAILPGPPPTAFEKTGP